MRRSTRLGLLSTSLLLLAAGAVAVARNDHPRLTLRDAMPLPTTLCFAAFDGTNRPSAKPSDAGGVTFTVRSEISGPWRVGALTYMPDGSWQRAADGSTTAPSALKPGGLRATFTLPDSWRGPLLPSLTSPTGVRSTQKLRIDDATGSLLRATERTRTSYTVAIAPLPKVSALGLVRDVDEGLDEFLTVPSPPPRAEPLVASFTGPPWDRFDAARNWVLDSIVAVNLGEPRPLPMSRVDEILRDRRANPFEIAALQVLMGRWVGVPTRLVYGYDGGYQVGEHTLEVNTALHGTYFAEFNLGNFGWIPIVGTPLHADGSVCS